MKKLVLFGALIFVLSGCASTGDDQAAMAPASAESAKAMIDAAKSAQKKAAKVGGEWRDVGKFIKKAEEALSKKDYATAVKMAKKAKSQGEMGENQAMAEKDAKPWLF